MSRRRPKQQARWLLSEAHSGVDVQHVGEVAEELPLEVSQPPVISAELCLKRFPRDETRLSEVAHPIGQPGVDIEGEG